MANVIGRNLRITPFIALALVFLSGFYLFLSHQAFAQTNQTDQIPSDLAQDLQLGQSNPAPEQVTAVENETTEANVASDNGSQPVQAEDNLAPEVAKEPISQAVNPSLTASEQAIVTNQSNGVDNNDKHFNGNNNGNNNDNNLPSPPPSGQDQNSNSQNNTPIPTGDSQQPANPASNPLSQPPTDLNVTNPIMAPDDNTASPTPIDNSSSDNSGSNPGSVGTSSSDHRSDNSDNRNGGDQAPPSE